MDTLSTSIILPALCEAELSCNNRILGSQLGLTTGQLNIIEGYCSNPYSEEYRAHVIEKRLETAELTWSQLVTALRQPALKMSAAATRIEKKYITSRSLSLSSSETMSNPPQSPVSLSLSSALEDSASLSSSLKDSEQASMSLLMGHAQSHGLSDS